SRRAGGASRSASTGWSACSTASSAHWTSASRPPRPSTRSSARTPAPRPTPGLSGQAQLEAGPPPELRLEHELASERLRELARDRKPEARSLAGPRPERAEDPLALLRPDARARVRNRDRDCPVHRAKAEVDASAVGSPRECVVEEIGDDLQQPVTVRV